MTSRCYLLALYHVVAVVLLKHLAHEGSVALSFWEPAVAHILDDAEPALVAVHDLKHGGVVLPRQLGHSLGVTF